MIYKISAYVIPRSIKSHGDILSLGRVKSYESARQALKISV